jgi:hypothetical protein
MLTTQDIIERLHKKMGDGQYQNLIESIEEEFNELMKNNENDLTALDTLYYKHVFPHVRQQGYKTEIKTRKIVYEKKDMSIFKYNSELGQKLQGEMINTYSNFEDLEYEERLKLVIQLGYRYDLIVETNHYSMWVAGKIYHWGPGERWRMYGFEESNKEVTNEWNKSEKYNGIYFTLYEHNELKKFCDEWNTKNNFDSMDSSSKFIDSLVDYMDLLEFSL